MKEDWEGVWLWRISGGDTNQLPLLTVIRTSAAKKLSRPGSQFPRGCMDNVFKSVDKWVDKWVYEKVVNQQTVANAGGSAGSRTPDHLIKSQMPY